MTVPQDVPDPAPVIYQRYLPPIVLMGDSRSEYAGSFPYVRNTLYNLGVAGSTTRSIVKRLYRLKSINPKYVFITTGINDYQIDYSEFVTNLNTVAKFIHDMGSICVITEQGLHPNQAAIQPQLIPYGNAMKTIANSYYLSVGYQLSDFIDTIAHFNTQGYQKLANAMISHFNGNKTTTRDPEP